MIQCGNRARQCDASRIRRSGRCRPAAPISAARPGSSAINNRAMPSKLSGQQPALGLVPRAHHHNTAGRQAARRRPPNRAARSSVIITRGISQLRRAALRSSALRPMLWLARFAIMTISQNLTDILARIEAARKAAIQPAPATQPGGGVQDRGRRTASAKPSSAGQRLFGENRVQEAQGEISCSER